MKFLLLLPLALLGVFFLGPPGAEAKCWPNGPHDQVPWQAGRYVGMGDVYRPSAVSTLAYTYDPWVDDVAPTEKQRSMIEVSLLLDISYHATVGWEEGPRDIRVSFFEYSLSRGVHWREYRSATPENTQAVFAVYTDKWPGFFTFHVGPPSTSGQAPTMIGYGRKYFTPNWSSIGGLITSKAHQLPGARYVPQTFHAAYIKDGYGNWFWFISRPYAGDGMFMEQEIPSHPVYGGMAFKIWDNRCSY